MSLAYTGDAATTRTNLGLGDAATKTVGTGAGNIPVLDGSGKLPAVSGENLTGIVALPTGGSVGQVVTNTAAGTGTWQDAAGGGAWTLIGSVTASNDANITVTGLSSSFDNYVIILNGVQPSSNGQGIYLRLGDVTSFYTSNHAYHTMEVYNNSSSYSGFTRGTSGLNYGFALHKNMSSSQLLNGSISLATNQGKSSVHGTMEGRDTSGQPRGGVIIGSISDITNATRVMLIAQTGNIATGRLSVYGISHT